MNSRKVQNTKTAYLCLSPAIAGLFLITILPMIGVIIISFTQWSGLRPPTFVGFQNYIRIFTEDFFFVKSVFVTLYFALATVAGGTLYSFASACLLSRKVPAWGVLRTIYFIPYIIPAIATTVLWSWMYDANFGVFNFVLDALGFDKVLWLQREAVVVPALALMTIWTCGNFIVIYLAGLQNVPRTYLEAVEIDGGNAWHKFFHVTIPLMSPIILFNFLMSTIVQLQIFVPAYALTREGPNNATLFMVYYIYREGFMRNNMGYACSISLIFFVFICLLTALIFKTSRKWLFYEGE